MINTRKNDKSIQNTNTLISSTLQTHLDKLTKTLRVRIIDHPLINLISQLEIAELFVGQYLHFAFDIPRITGIRYGLCRDESIRRRLLSVMIEEDGYLGSHIKSHYELALITAKSLNIDNIPDIHLSTITLLNALEMQYQSSLIAGIASSYAREGLYPILMPKISQQLTLANPLVNTVFFDVHATGDIEHSQSALECLCQISTQNDLQLIEQSVCSGLGFLISWYDSLYMEIK